MVSDVPPQADSGVRIANLMSSKIIRQFMTSSFPDTRHLKPNFL
jgi:hypothetical protein